jgi:hypothetical protein
MSANEPAIDARAIVFYLVAGAVVVGGGVVFVPSDLAGEPRSDVGTFGAGLVSGSHPTANAPTQIVRTNANDFRMVSDSYSMFVPRAGVSKAEISGEFRLAQQTVTRRSRQDIETRTEQSVRRAAWRAYSPNLLPEPSRRWKAKLADFGDAAQTAKWGGIPTRKSPVPE